MISQYIVDSANARHVISLGTTDGLKYLKGANTFQFQVFSMPPIEHRFLLYMQIFNDNKNAYISIATDGRNRHQQGATAYAAERGYAAGVAI